MRLHLFIYKCHGCGCEFKVPELPGNPYGIFLMRTESGQTALLRAFERREFEEVDTLLAGHPRVSLLDRYERAELLHQVFGVACDPAPDGTSYVLNGAPPCPTCHSRRMIGWQATAPPEFVFQDVAEVTHERWNQLDAPGKLHALDVMLTG